MGGESTTTGALERTNQLGGELLKVTVRDSAPKPCGDLRVNYHAVYELWRRARLFFITLKGRILQTKVSAR